MLTVRIARGVIASTALISVACGSSSGSSAPPSSSATAPSATATAAGKAFGTAVTTSTGATYTVLAWQPVQPKSATANTPQPGGAFFAANVQECAGNGSTLTTDPTAWTVELSENGESQGRDASQVATPGPPLATGATLASGQCATGWVAFTGFLDSVGHQLHVTGVDSYWAIP